MFWSSRGLMVKILGLYPAGPGFESSKNHWWQQVEEKTVIAPVPYKKNFTMFSTKIKHWDRLLAWGRKCESQASVFMHAFVKNAKKASN